MFPFVQLRDGALRIGFVAHLDEGEPARLSGRAIGDDRHAFDLTDLREQRVQIGFAGVIGQIADV